MTHVHVIQLARGRAALAGRAAGTPITLAQRPDWTCDSAGHLCWPLSTLPGLQFCGQFGKADVRKQRLVYSHTLGSAVLHLGRQRHGANNITAGERLNLIIWGRSSAFRGAAAFGHVPVDGHPQEREEEGPHRVCLSRFNDPDYNAQLKRLRGEQQATTSPSPAPGDDGTAEAPELAESAPQLAPSECRSCRGPLDRLVLPRRRA